MIKPSWLNKRMELSSCRKMKILLRELNIHTICEEALCPNVSECFSLGVATFMILGRICTRNCKFCAVEKGTPKPIDLTEPFKVKEAVERLNLRYVVVTSPSRDDLEDKGAKLFYSVIEEVKRVKCVEKVEALIPDFSLNINAIRMVVSAQPQVISHNIETVASLYKILRPSYNYIDSLKVLEMVKKLSKDIFVKSGIILGFGEEDKEVVQTIGHLRDSGCDFLSIGQYLSPSKNCFPVKEYVSLEKFNYFREVALSLGFLNVFSGPYVRSSYLASMYFDDLVTTL
ncbi:MAG: lipoyl synthase [Candidatus Omnitrophica bacterium]|nr:lipoyl synthase [Candidatus Omnitrophota bacterium]MCM8826170.1 lipoyl synthase [Candidatus Omnitrophota bacterium]